MLRLSYTTAYRLGHPDPYLPRHCRGCRGRTLAVHGHAYAVHGSVLHLHALPGFHLLIAYPARLDGGAPHHRTTHRYDRHTDHVRVVACLQVDEGQCGAQRIDPHNHHTERWQLWAPCQPLCIWRGGDGHCGAALRVHASQRQHARRLSRLGWATTSRQAFRNLASVPLLYATALALIARALAITLPTPLLRGVGLCGAAAVPVLLLMLGIQLAQLQMGRDIGPTTLAMGLRLVVAPLLAVVLTDALGMEGLIRMVSIAQ